MRNRRCAMYAFVQIGLLSFLAVFADNPIIQTNYTADPAPMVYNDTVFLYTSHDEDNASGFVMYNWMLYTSTDMVNWRDHGMIAGVRAPYKTFTWADDINAWAVQCIFRNNKFYLYCPVRQGGQMCIGVAVSNSPYGPFTDPIGKPLVRNSGEDIDPTAFIDDDGQAYMHWGNPNCYYVKLNQDMTSYSGGVVKLPKIQTYQEGPWVYKRNNKYYNAFASTCCPEGIGYAMSDAPTGPWTYKGSIMDGNSNSSGNHPGIIDYKGKTYVFGFDYELVFFNLGSRSNRPERRSICVKEMTYNTDGTIPKLPWWGVGVPQPSVSQVGTFNPYETVQAETICWSFGVRTKVCSEGGMHVDSIHNGDYIKVKGVDFGSGAKSFEARVASATSGGNIELRLDTTTGPIVGTCAVTGTNGWQTWATKTCTATNASGVHDLYLKFTGGNGLLFAFNWWRFAPSVIASQRNGAAQAAAVFPFKADYHLTNGNAVVGYALQNARRVTVSIFDQQGRRIAVIADGIMPAGRHAVVWDTKQIPAGVYFWKMSVDGRAAEAGKLIVGK